MDYAIFCYRDDRLCLPVCLDQVRRVDADARFWVFDDGRCPLVEGDVPVGDDVRYEVTWFERNGNLNGLECMRGMLGCMYRIPGSGPVVKLDADTLLMGLGWVDGGVADGKQGGGVQCMVGLAWSGCCYWLTRRAIEDGLSLLVRREWPVGRDGYPEDQWISKVMLFLYGGRGVDVHEFKGGRLMVGVRGTGSEYLAGVGALVAESVQIVHCGQMDFYGDVAERLGCGLRGACAWVMERVLEFSNINNS